jgi:hypothetical protein
MTEYGTLRPEPSPVSWNGRCRYCQKEPSDPPLLPIDPRPHLEDWLLCEACWLLLEIGFSDAHPYDDLYRRLAPTDGRLGDAEMNHYILRGWALLQRSARRPP